MKKSWFFTIIIIIVVVIGLFFIHKYYGGLNQIFASNEKPLYWIAPNDPNYWQDHPGKSPTGQQLVPVYTEVKARPFRNILIVPKAFLGKLDLKTSQVVRGNLYRVIKTVGYITSLDKTTQEYTIVAEVAIDQGKQLKQGQKAQATVVGQTGKWIGELTQIAKESDIARNSMKVQLSFPEPEFKVASREYVNLLIYTQPEKNVLIVPEQAIYPSNKENYVILDLGNGQFIWRKVNIGLESQDKVVVAAGLKAGDKVITNGAGLLAIEAQLQLKKQASSLHSKQ